MLLWDWRNGRKNHEEKRRRVVFLEKGIIVFSLWDFLFQFLPDALVHYC
jgi:hypothetical protein